jgi:hypothetical protein
MQVNHSSLAIFLYLPSNTYLKSHWVSLYNTISRANVVLANIDRVSFTDALKQQYTAEAKFLRAVMYFHLVRYLGRCAFGDQPFQYNRWLKLPRIPSAKGQRQFYAPDSSRFKRCFEQCLPNLQAGAELVALSKAAINATLGQVYLTMATTQDQAESH